MTQQLIALVGAFLLSLMITPIFRRIAMQCGLIDKPDKNRKLHSGAVALSGGVAVFLSCAIGASLALLFSEGIRRAIVTQPFPVFGLAISSSGMVLLGLLDDAFNVRGRQKLAGQFVLVSIAVLCGFKINAIGLFGTAYPLGLFVIPVSIGWLLLTVNALNLIDGADGLCSTVGWVASAGFAFMCAYTQHPIEAAIAASLTGALLGFLVFNWPPAKIFLGDAGSMLIGLILGLLAIRTNLKEATAISLLGTVAILAIPIMDSGMAILRRKLTGRSIFAVDRGHLHHKLLGSGFSAHSLVIVVTLTCGILAIGAVLSAILQNEFIAIVAILIVTVSLIATRLFGYSELAMLTKRMGGFGNSLLPRHSGREVKPNMQRMHFQGSRNWEVIWETLTEYAKKHDLARICLDLNVPWLHEGFHATWKQKISKSGEQPWSTKLPVVANEKQVGRIEIVGFNNQYPIASCLRDLAELVEGLQDQIDLICSDAVVHAGDLAFVSNHDQWKQDSPDVNSVETIRGDEYHPSVTTTATND
jgi:UDP-GlcNAc:undecaprenyl-phosphate GlcNAc-1-phosphate transferase